MCRKKQYSFYECAWRENWLYAERGNVYCLSAIKIRDSLLIRLSKFHKQVTGTIHRRISVDFLFAFLDP